MALTNSPPSELLDVMGSQQPRIRVVPEYVSSAGGEAIECAALAGLLLDPWEQLVLVDALGERANGKWAAFEVGTEVPRQNGKGPHSLDTPILTTDGWTTFADIHAGQSVYGPDGLPTAVVAVSDILLGERCYELEFTDHAALTVGESHLWPIFDKGSAKWRVMETREIAATRWGWRRANGRMEYAYRVRCDAVPQTPEVELPIDPYIFGAWLGDGKSDSVELTAHGDDLPFVREQLALAGYEIGAEWRHDHPTTWQVSFRRGAKWCSGGLRSDLRALGVFGNKHIPECYLTASPAQRVALLQGLMDTDGTIACTNRSPQVEFSSSSPGLARDFQRLARSLGIRVTPKWRTTTRRDNCRFAWTPTFNPFRMPRKASKFCEPNSKRHRLMSIVGLREVPSVPVRCIQIEREDGIYLVGHQFTPTHNSILEARELAGVFAFGEKLLIHSAHEQLTATNHFRRLLDLMEGVPEFDRRIMKAVRGKGSEAIEFRGGQAIFFKTRTGGGGRGLSGDFVALDEAMILPIETTGALVPTMAARSVMGNPQLWYAWSAVDKENPKHDGLVATRLRMRALAGVPSIAYFNWSADIEAWMAARGRRFDPKRSEAAQVTPEMLDDLELWLQANPGTGIRISVEHIQRERGGALGPREFAVERLGLTDPPDVSEDADRVIAREKWAAAAENDRSNRIVSDHAFAVDVNPDRSWGSIAIAGRREDGLAQFAVRERQRGTAWIVARCVELANDHPDASFVVLGHGPAANLIPELEAGGLVVVAASGQDFGVACADFYDAIEHAAARYPFPQLDLDDALAGAQKSTGQENVWTWSRKASTSPDISPLVAVTLALWNARTQQPLVPMVAFR